MAIVVFLDDEETNSMKLTQDNSAIKPPSITRFCNWPMFNPSSVDAEKRICMEVCRDSQPNKLLEMTIKIVMHSANMAIQMVIADDILIYASLRLPCRVLLKISSAPVWYSEQNRGAVVITHRNISRNRYIPSYSYIFLS